jgi:chemotaxis protein methyltransferase CheR
MSVAATDYTYVTELVGRRSAVMLGTDKQYLVESRLSPVARDLGLGSVGELIARLRTTADSALATRVVDAMTTKETSFFRDVHPFNALRDYVLPAVIEKERLRRRLRIWSAACSTGQELYTIAIVIDQMPELAGWDVTLRGTDLSREALDKARAGRYSGLEVNRGLPAPLLVRYFEREGLNYRANERLRNAVSWGELNLIEPLPTTSLWDVVFIRNVLIYFDTPTKRRVLEAIRRSMTPGGFLMLGGAETTLGLVDCFAPVHVGAATVYRAEAP